MIGGPVSRCLVVAIGLGSLTPQATEEGTMTIRTLSTRPDLVSGGDVLVEVRSTDSARLNRVVVMLRGGVQCYRCLRNGPSEVGGEAGIRAR